MKTNVFGQLALALGLLQGACQSGQTVATTDPIAGRVDTTAADTFRIAFGSCNHQDRQQPLWPEIAAQQPDLWVWLGDNIYGDTEDMDLMARKYEKQLGRPEYVAFARQTEVVGVWDDHDFGVNDGGKFYPKKAESKALMLDFLNAPAEDVRRTREGAYTSYTFGEGDRRVKVILLDTRTFRDTLDRVRNADGKMEYQPNPEGDILGEAQWNWLESELREGAAVNLVGSSIQVISSEHYWEKWSNFPVAHRRLYDLVAQTQASGVVFLSGDRHIAELSRYDTTGVAYPLYDFTSSGLTHTWGSGGDEPNRFREQGLIIALNYGLVDVTFGNEGPEVLLTCRGDSNQVFFEKRLTF